MAAVNTAFRSVEELTREELNELKQNYVAETRDDPCLLYASPSPRDR